MKYIIEFEDEPSMVQAGHRYYQCKQVPYWSISHGIIKNLTPYTEPDRKSIEDEVWGFVRDMFWTPEDFGATLDDSYREAKAKYEDWKSHRGKLQFGDIVRYVEPDGTMINAVVMEEINDDGDYWVFTENGIIERYNKGELIRTEKHLHSVDVMLNILQEDI